MDTQTVEDFQSDALWIVVVGFIIAFILLCANGANDTASAFGTSVGAKVLKLWQAYVLATIFETLGAALIGHEVTDTMRKNVIDLEEYNQSAKELMLGQMSALSSTSVWLVLATFLRLPVSSTQSTMGSTLGYGVISRGFDVVQWDKIGLIIGSWFVSPVLSGTFASLAYRSIAHLVLLKKDPLTSGLKMLPVFYFITIIIGLFSIFFDGPSLLHFDRIPIWGVLIITLGGGLIGAIVVKFFIVPRIRRWISKSVLREQSILGSSNGQNSTVQKKRSGAVEKTASGEEEPQQALVVNKKDAIHAELGYNDSRVDESPHTASTWRSRLPSLRVDVEEQPHAAKLFSFLQILSACFGLFAHGANDLSNAIAPLVSLWMIYNSGSHMPGGEASIWVRFYAVISVSVGLWALGHRVIYTVGEGLTQLSPASGFSVEIGSAFTVLLASKIGLPVSTTYCKVSAVVCVGWLNYETSVNWKTFRNIVISWIVTLPFTALLSSFIMWLLHFTL